MARFYSVPIGERVGMVRVVFVEPRSRFILKGIILVRRLTSISEAKILHEIAVGVYDLHFSLVVIPTNLEEPLEVPDL